MEATISSFAFILKSENCNCDVIKKKITELVGSW